MSKRSFYVLAIILLLIVSYFIAGKLSKNYIPQIKLAAVDLKDLDGSNVNLAGFAGKPLVINFWGTWCGPCRKELPQFEKAKGKYKGQVNFIMVSDEPAGKIIKFKAENNYTFFYAQSQKAFHDLGIVSVPVTYFYDAKGKLVTKRKDPLNEEDINEFIAEIIKAQ